MSMKRECESVSEFMAQMKAALEEVQNAVEGANTKMSKAVDDVAGAVNKTMEAANQAFPEVSSN